MPTFTFPLQVLLEQRRRERRDKRQAVAAVEAERLECESFLREKQRCLEENKQQVRTLLLRAESEAIEMDANELRRYAAVALAVDLQARQTVLKLAGIHRRLSQVREQLRLADIRLKVVDQLRERQYERFRWEENRREANELDELAVMRAARRDEELS